MPEPSSRPRRKKKGGLSCCSSRNKGSERKRGQRPGMRARGEQELPVGVPAAKLPPLQPEADVDSPPASHQRLVCPVHPVPAHAPEEALRPAAAAADVEEIAISFDDPPADEEPPPAAHARPRQAAARSTQAAATEPIALGGYEADKADLLGKGAFGVVYGGVDKTSGARVAVKLIPMLPSSDEGFGEEIRQHCVIYRDVF